MPFYADLHLHSKYARGTSRDCDLEHLSLAARQKGISVLATGDFTHPAWMAELSEKLIPAEGGLFRLRPEIEREIDRHAPPHSTSPTRFMLGVEISTIYRKGDRARKVHHLVYAPDFDAANRFVLKLSRIGNLGADGRPILGLDSEQLLEMALECGDGVFLVPAHLWTPWFSALGSKSGFDSLSECYGSLTNEIFAVETGLSSDPPMNWRVSQLDGLTLVSNSDAHSPRRLARECSVFGGPMDYFSMRQALKTGQTFGGTIEFFPEEGKYHLDGHRNCRVRLTPSETRMFHGRCTACGKPVTVGVLHRVESLADRSPSDRPPRLSPFTELVPLEEVIAETEGVGAATKTVARLYREVVQNVGSELTVLMTAPAEDIRRHGSSLLAEALVRLRAGRVIREAGYDGEYGRIRLFSPDELVRARSAAVRALFSTADSGGREEASMTTPGQSADDASEEGRPAREHPDHAPPPRVHFGEDISSSTEADSRHHADGEPESEYDDGDASGASALADCLSSLDPDQRRVAVYAGSPLLVIAGPGTGKTLTLTHHAAHLVGARGIDPDTILSLTFTRRAAGDMRDRLEGLLPGATRFPHIMTFDALGWSIVREHATALGLSDELAIADEQAQADLLAAVLGTGDSQARRHLASIAAMKRHATGAVPGPPTHLPRTIARRDAQEVAIEYQEALQARALIDLDDLMGFPLKLFRSDPRALQNFRRRFNYLLVDDFQDLSGQQYALLRLITPTGSDPGLTVAGDPDQAICGFRGSPPALLAQFERDYPDAQLVRLRRSYRMDGPILRAAAQVVAAGPDVTSAQMALERRSSQPKGAPAESGALDTACATVWLTTDRESLPLKDTGQKVVTFAASSDRSEAEFVAHTIEELVGIHALFAGDSPQPQRKSASAYAYSDVAILFRTESQSQLLVEAMDRAGIPWQRRSHRRLIQHPFLTWFRHYLRETAHHSPQLLAAAVDRAATRLRSLARSEMIPIDSAFLVESFAPWITALAERHGPDASQFVAELSLDLEVDSLDVGADRVSLLTLHASKGLEFPIVFVVGCEDGVIPLRSGDAHTPETVDEERRLLYVAMTRAKERLYLSHARQRLWRGKVRQLPSTPFLRAISPDEIDYLASARRQRREARRESYQLSLF